MLIYKFKDINSKKSAYVVRAKTKGNYPVSNFGLSVCNEATAVIKVEMVVSRNRY